MHLVFTATNKKKGEIKGASVARGNDVLVRNDVENANRIFSTNYERRNELNDNEIHILADNLKEGIGNNSVDENFQPVVGDGADNGTKLSSQTPGFKSSEYNQFDKRQRFRVAVPQPPTQNQINTTVNNLAAQIDLNTDKLSNASRTAAKNLGRLLLSSTSSSATLSVTFLDQSGTNSFMRRPATNNPTFGNNANTQVRSMVNIIQGIPTPYDLISCFT